jgi:hypothetical protein
VGPDKQQTTIIFLIPPQLRFCKNLDTTPTNRFTPRNHTPSEKKDKKKDKNQLFETAVKQLPGGYTNSTKYEKAP